MKEFEFLDLEDFLEVADGLQTPFKFYETERISNIICVSAKVWLRTAYISFHFESSNKEEIDVLEERLLNHGFNRVKIKETAIPVK